MNPRAMIMMMVMRMIMKRKIMAGRGLGEKVMRRVMMEMVRRERVKRRIGMEKRAVKVERVATWEL